MSFIDYNVMDLDLKNRIGHRGKAVTKLVFYLKNIHVK